MPIDRVVGLYRTGDEVEISQEFHILFGHRLKIVSGERNLPDLTPVTFRVVAQGRDYVAEDVRRNP